MTPRMLEEMRRLAPLRGYAAALAAVALVSVIIGAIEARAHIANISMLYLMAVLAAATLLGRGPAITASIASFLAFNWFFVEPIHTLTVGDPKEWFALVLDVGEKTLALGICPMHVGLPEAPRGRDDRRERRAKVVRHGAEQSVLQFVRPSQDLSVGRALAQPRALDRAGELCRYRCEDAIVRRVGLR